MTEMQKMVGTEKSTRGAEKYTREKGGEMDNFDTYSHNKVFI